MNEQVIMQMIHPYVKDSSITYQDFDNIFNILSKKEQYEISDLLYEKGINLIDESERIDEEHYILDTGDYDNINMQEDTQIQYDQSIFEDQHDIGEEYVKIKYDIYQSNIILCKLIQEGNKQAVQDICIKNRGLVDKCVYIYQKRYGNQFEFEDLEQVGFMGLIKAAKKFNMNYENEFSTYAVFWIRQAISREIMDHGYVIRIPVHMMERINKVSYLDNKFFSEGESFNVRVNHISKEMSLKVEDVLECLNLKNNYLSYASLNLPVGEDNELELLNMIPQEDEISVEEKVFHNMLKETLDSIVNTLTLREQTVIKLRFGLDDEIPRTLEEIGKIFGVTRERIRQIEVKALKKLKLSSRSKLVEGYL